MNAVAKRSQSNRDLLVGSVFHCLRFLCLLLIEALVVADLCGINIATAQLAPTSDPLSSWNDSASKKAIVDFVQKVTAEGTPGFVPVAERIAVFDNDGTLWPENPEPFQLAYALDLIKQRSAVDSKLAADPMVGRLSIWQKIGIQFGVPLQVQVRHKGHAKSNESEPLMCRPPG